MLYTYQEMLEKYGTDYMIKKAIQEKKIYKIEKGIYSDGEKNFTEYELILKIYPDAFLVKDTALSCLGFLRRKPEKIHLGTSRNALRIKDHRVIQHFYSFLDEGGGLSDRILSRKNIRTYKTETGNEIRIFNLHALLYDVIRNYSEYSAQELEEILEEFKTCKWIYDFDKYNFEDNLMWERKEIIYLKFEATLNEIGWTAWDNDFKRKYDW